MIIIELIEEFIEKEFFSEYDEVFFTTEELKELMEEIETC